MISEIFKQVAVPVNLGDKQFFPLRETIRRVVEKDSMDPAAYLCHYGEDWYVVPTQFVKLVLNRESLMEINIERMRELSEYIVRLISNWGFEEFSKSAEPTTQTVSPCYMGLRVFKRADPAVEHIARYNIQAFNKILEGDNQ